MLKNQIVHKNGELKNFSFFMFFSSKIAFVNTEKFSLMKNRNSEFGLFVFIWDFFLGIMKFLRANYRIKIIVGERNSTVN